jgi:hypothetical protein
MARVYYVAVDGNDQWSGTIPEPNGGRTDGPFASITRARDVAADLDNDDGAIRIEIRGGVYELDSPFRLEPKDSGSKAPTKDWNIQSGPGRSTTYAAYDGEEPVLSGGTVLTGWYEDTLGDEAVWVTKLPAVATGTWNFTQLWVNGRRASRPKYPKEGLFTMEEPLGEVVYEGNIHDTLFTGQDEFRYRAGDINNWKNVEDIEFVGLHYWIESRINFTEIDTKTRSVKLARKSRMRLTDDFDKEGAPYYVENVFEAFAEATAEAGTWYLDRPTGTLYYRPVPGENLDTASIVAPRLNRVIEISGTGDAYVHDIQFEGIAFSHTEWVPGREVETATPQAACHVGGAVHLERACDVRFESCEFSHLGSYGIEIAGGSHDVDVSRCTITDLGGGGVKVWHSFEAGDSVIGAGPDWNHTESCRRVRITDSVISFGGYRFHQAVGVLIGMCSGVQLLHNEIHDFDYSGVSVGWTWSYEEGHAYGNLIEYNHIYNIGRNMLSDMGGIYTLGVQPGTRLTHNLIHDVWSRGYGGWGIYNDEGSSHILVENNIVYRTKSNGYNQHYGEDNIIRNNIFAFGGEAQYSRGRLEEHTSFRFTNNILYFDSDGKVLAGSWDRISAVIDDNLYYNKSGKPLEFDGASLDVWQARGADNHSVVGDPKFRDPDSGDFSFLDESSARSIGFRPFDLSTVGPRPAKKRSNT